MDVDFYEVILWVVGNCYIMSMYVDFGVLMYCMC